MLIETLKNKNNELGLKDTYAVIPSRGIEIPIAYEYWSALFKHGLLKDRLSDLDDPDISEAMDFWVNSDNLYGVIHCESGDMVADFAIGHITGKAGQLHFGFFPKGLSRKVKLELAQLVHGLILNTWRDPSDAEKSYLDTIYGLTPLQNKLACAFVLKAGMRKVAVVPHACTHLNAIDDAMLTIKTSETHYGR